MSEKNKNWRDLDWRLNVYWCTSCMSPVTTVDVDDGCTPFIISCPKCDHDAQSSMYPPSRPVPADIPEPAFEFYRAKDKDVAPLDKYHHRAGGLFQRPRTQKEPIMHKPDYCKREK